VKEFIQRHIQSVDQLDSLMLLRSAPRRRWTPDDVGRALEIKTEFAQVALESLVTNGLCRSSEEHGSMTFEAEILQAEDGLRELDEVYQEQRLAMLILISRQAIGRVRLDARQTFFEAIRKRRKKPE
jgi:hypothetical protein